MHGTTFLRSATERNRTTFTKIAILKALYISLLPLQMLYVCVSYRWNEPVSKQQKVPQRWIFWEKAPNLEHSQLMSKILPLGCDTERDVCGGAR
jgi:hypothetical protein